MAEASYSYDAFISYRHEEPDTTWVRKTLVHDLEAAGLKVCIDYRDFRLTAHLLAEMARAVEESRWTVAVLSPAYLDGNFTDLENIWADHLGQTEREARLIWVVREPCTPSSIRIRARLRLDLTTDAAYAEGLPRLIATMQAPVEDTP